MKPPSSKTRAVVLLAVLVVVVIGVLVASSVQSLADSSTLATMSSSNFVQSRAAAWSGVQVVMADLASQRESLLSGEKPKLKSELLSWTEGRQKIVARLAVRSGTIAVPEAGKLDLNVCSSVMLFKLGLANAERIAERAKAQPFASVGEAIGFGASESADQPRKVSLGNETAGDSAGAVSHSVWGDLLTTYCFDPCVRAGVGNEGNSSVGVRRVNVTHGWTQAAKKLLSELLGSNNNASATESIATQSSAFSRRSQFVAKLRQLNIPIDRWGVLLDCFDFSSDEFSIGLVDLSSADEKVLAQIPGIGTEIAAQIVRTRERLSDQTRRSIAWPLESSLLSPEAFEIAVDYLTTRSLQFRVVVEAGFDAVDPERLGAATDSFDRSVTKPSAEVDGSTELTEPRLRQPIILEAVIDVASSRPRIAYLRDISHLAAYQAALNIFRQSSGATPDKSVGRTSKHQTNSPDSQDNRSEAGNNQPVVASQPHTAGDDAATVSLPAVARDRRIGRWTTISR